MEIVLGPWKARQTSLPPTVFIQRLCLILKIILHAINRAFTFPLLAMPTATKSSPVSPLRIVNISGPFIDGGHVTAIPTRKFLEGIRDPMLTRIKVPQHLVWVYGEGDNEEEVDLLAFHLCIALARHFSYLKTYAMHYHTNKVNSSNTTLYDLYKAFRESFGKACNILQDMAETDNMSLTDVTVGVDELKRLIELESLLTHETFHRGPALIVKTMATNAKLLERLTQMSSEDRVCQASDPEGLLETVQTRLQNEWIPLADAEDIMDGNSERYHRW